METYSITRTQFKVADFVSWQNEGLLDLTPPFQRRSVWRHGAKSLLVDTVARGLPTPIIFLRDRINLSTLRNTREVVDGQQRLRTLISFVAPDTLDDLDESRDIFTVRRAHNHEMAGRTFPELHEDVRRRILDYEFSVHVLPSSLEDRDILLLFARLNSTGERLSPQELRNAQFFGEFKVLMYELGIEQLERWVAWGVFNGDDVSRMKEIELTSDMVVSMLEGFGGKTQSRIKAAYARYDEAFPDRDHVAHRFRATMDAIEEIIGGQLQKTVFSREIWFQPLYYLVYEALFADAPMSQPKRPARLGPTVTARLLSVSDRIKEDVDLPDDVLDATRGASTDARSRRTRLAFLRDSVS